MKIDTTPSPWRYEAARHRAVALAVLRQPTITHHASREGASGMFRRRLYSLPLRPETPSRRCTNHPLALRPARPDHRTSDASPTAKVLLIPRGARWSTVRRSAFVRPDRARWSVSPGADPESFRRPRGRGRQPLGHVVQSCEATEHKVTLFVMMDSAAPDDQTKGLKRFRANAGTHGAFRSAISHGISPMALANLKP